MKASSTLAAVLVVVVASAAAACGSGSASGAAGSDAGTSEGGVTLRLAKNHRPIAAACSAPRPPGINEPREDGGTAPTDWCYQDADCTAGKDGRCSSTRGGAYSRRCTYSTCTQDTDCGSGKACLCNDEDGHACLAFGCRVDSECPDRLGCSPSGVGYQCHTTKDECIDDADCGGCNSCDYDQASKRWKCQPACAP